MSEVSKIIREALEKLEKLPKSPKMNALLSDAETFAEELECTSEQLLNKTKELADEQKAKRPTLAQRGLADLEESMTDTLDNMIEKHCPEEGSEPVHAVKISDLVEESSETERYFETNSHTFEGSRGTLIDPATYWWRGLPVSLSLSWIGGAFLCDIVRQSDDTIVGRYRLNIMDIFRYVEKDNKACMESLGDDYGHMFGLHVDHSDALHYKSWHWTDENNSVD